jgi:hypothetical protein
MNINTPLVIGQNCVLDFDQGTGAFTITINDVLAGTFTASAALALGLETIANHSVTAVADLDTSDTYTDASVNAMKDLIMTEITDLATKVNAILARLEAAGISASA